MYNDIGCCHFELGQADEALAHFTQALNLNDAHAPSYSNRANCLKGLRKCAAEARTAPDRPRRPLPSPH